MINASSVNRQKVVSPCVGKCTLDENDICVGCYRLVSEISGWLDTPEHEKIEIIARCRKRKNICIDGG
ncbi:MAG: DUF1289 domain-containing protein [Colwellia sp.]|nr:DUF1289 domain-containing protein [Colwellia sp.]